LTEVYEVELKFALDEGLPDISALVLYAMTLVIEIDAFCVNV
jgi:hypothetical protein